MSVQDLPPYVQGSSISLVLTAEATTKGWIGSEMLLVLLSISRLAGHGSWDPKT